MHPTLAALKRHKAGVVLLVVQIAVTLAIISNAVHIIGQRIERVTRPTGLEERDLFRVSQSWIAAPAGDDAASVEALDALQRTDLDVLRRLPDVAEVAASDSMPLQGAIWSGNVNRRPGQKQATIQAAYYYGDEHMRSTLGLQLIAGRDFQAPDVVHHTISSTATSRVVIVSKPVADALFPAGDALGKTLYLDEHPTVIVGIVARLQTPTIARWGSGWSYHSILRPVRLDGTSASYAVRAKPGRLEAAMREARAGLFQVNPMRVMPDSWGMQSFAQIRAKAYSADRGMAMLMGVVCAILLGVTAAGIVGLTSFWVGQRQHQIGVRRALGARSIDILRHFQTENLLIAGIGVMLGLLLSVALNLWLMTRYELPQLPMSYPLLGVLAMLALGQAAVFVPARRASRVPPVVATRSV